MTNLVAANLSGLKLHFFNVFLLNLCSSLMVSFKLEKLKEEHPYPCVPPPASCPGLLYV